MTAIKGGIFFKNLVALKFI